MFVDNSIYKLKKTKEYLKNEKKLNKLNKQLNKIKGISKADFNVYMLAPFFIYKDKYKSIHNLIKEGFVRDNNGTLIINEEQLLSLKKILKFLKRGERTFIRKFYDMF